MRAPRRTQETEKLLDVPISTCHRGLVAVFAILLVTSAVPSVPAFNGDQETGQGDREHDCSGYPEFSSQNEALIWFEDCQRELISSYARDHTCGSSSACEIFYAIFRECFGVDPEDQAALGWLSASGPTDGDPEACITALDPIREDFATTGDSKIQQLVNAFVMFLRLSEELRGQADDEVRNVHELVPYNPPNNPSTLISDGAWYIEIPKDELGMRFDDHHATADITQVGSLSFPIPSDPKISQNTNVNLMDFDDGTLISESPPSSFDKALAWGGCGIALGAGIAATATAPVNPAGVLLVAGAGAAAGSTCAYATSVQSNEGKFVCAGQHEVRWGGGGGNTAEKDDANSILDATLKTEQSSSHQGVLRIPYPWAAGGTYEEGRAKCREAWEAAKIKAEEDAGTWQETEGNGHSSINVEIDIAETTSTSDMINEGIDTVYSEIYNSKGEIVGFIMGPEDGGAIREVNEELSDKLPVEPAILVWDCSDSCPLSIRLSLSSCGTGNTAPEGAGVEYEFVGDPGCLTASVYINDHEEPVVEQDLPLILRGEFQGEGTGRTEPVDYGE